MRSKRVLVATLSAIACAVLLLAGVLLWPERDGGAPPVASVSSEEPPEATAPPSDATADESGAPQGNARLGLHVTVDELAAWRDRATEGPYLVGGDVSQNSPGDWERITANAESFMDDPQAGRWEGPSDNNPRGCVRQDGGDRTDEGWRPPLSEADYLRDAAFVALVTEDREMASTVVEEVLAQSQEDGVDFSDSDRWCEGVILDVNPGFSIANWLTKYLFAVDYVEALDDELLPDRDRRRLEEWFTAGAEWMRYDIEYKLDALFLDRPSGDYTLTEVAETPTEAGRVAYFDGPEVLTLHRRWNNRNARQARYVTLVGIWTDNDEFVEFGKEFVKDALRFSYFPEGAVGDFERWTRRNPTKGWKYGGEFVGALVSIADHLARAGDTELYEFETTEGALGTEGAHELTGKPKSLHTLVLDMMYYVDHTYTRYGTDRQRDAGKRQYLIDSVNQLKDDPRITDIALVMANHYFDDDYIREVYTREADGAPPYPQDPGQGRGEAASGEGGIYPGVLFMFGGLEDRRLATGPLPLASG